jgi:hypothetical protein
MSVVINVQPSAATTVQFVQNEVQPPSLLIFDGTTTVVFTPAPIQGALHDVEAFAKALVRAGTEWAMACARAIEATQVSDPFRLEELFAEQGDRPGQGSG